MEDCVVINFLNLTPVAKFVLAIGLMGTLAHYQNPSEMLGLVLIWVLVSDLLAWVKEASLGQTSGTDASFHCFEGADTVSL